MNQNQHWIMPSKHLDRGIEKAVMILRESGINTIESCEGGAGQAFPDPTIVFTGGKAEGYKALSVALHHGLAVVQLRRVWARNRLRADRPLLGVNACRSGNRAGRISCFQLRY